MKKQMGYANAKNTGVAVGQNALAATGGVAIGKGVFEDTNNNLAGGVVIGQDSASTGIYSLVIALILLYANPFLSKLG